MDVTQIILLSAVIVLTIFVVIMSFQAFLTLKDFRKTLGKLNHLMDDTDDLVGKVKKPIESVGGVFSALTAGAGIAHFLKKIKNIEDHDERSKGK